MLKDLFFNFEKNIRKYEVTRIPYKIFRTIIEIVQALIFSWIPLILKNPQAVRFMPQWFISFRPGGITAFKERIPWMPFGATEWLKHFLKKDMKVFEWGSGGSTLFIAKRVKQIVSVEHDIKFHAFLSELFKKDNIFNCEYIVKEPVFSSDNKF